MKAAANTPRKSRRFMKGVNHRGSCWILEPCSRCLSKMRELLRSFCEQEKNRAARINVQNVEAPQKPPVLDKL